MIKIARHPLTAINGTHPTLADQARDPVRPDPFGQAVIIKQATRAAGAHIGKPIACEHRQQPRAQRAV